MKQEGSGREGKQFRKQEEVAEKAINSERRRKEVEGRKRGVEGES